MTRAARSALVRRAVASLRAHALRSALSILGILFGVASITAMSSVTEGARREALSQIGDLGADTLVARVRATVAAGIRPELTVEDSARLRSALPGLLTLAPIRSAAVGEWELAMDSAVTGSRLLAIEVEPRAARR